MDKLVSIIIPCYNGEKYLIDAITSVKSQIYKNIEIIVVNDASIDATQDILDSVDNIKIITNNVNKGVAGALNEGIKVSSGDYIIALGCDDSFPINYVSELMKLDADIVSANMKRIGVVNDTQICQKLVLSEIRRMNGLNYAALVKRSLYDAVGLYDELSPGYEDWDFWIRCARFGATHLITNDTYLIYRVAEQSEVVRCDNIRETIFEYFRNKHVGLFAL